MLLLLLGIGIHLSVSSQWTLTGPGLRPDTNILPCRYFFIQPSGSNTSAEISRDEVEVSIMGEDLRGRVCRAHTELLRVSRARLLVRYKLHYSCRHLAISVRVAGRPLAASPATVPAVAHPDTCSCPDTALAAWLGRCPASVTGPDLAQWRGGGGGGGGVDMRAVVAEARAALSQGGSQCWCHYAVKAGAVYRQCFGQHTGFSMFWDSVLGWLARRAALPDTEIIVNLGDWPLARRRGGPRVPMVSWCGAADSWDLVVPTYELTESHLECMGRQSLDVLAALGKNNLPWEKKEEKLFWRGRDSNKERLKLVRLGQQYPDLINASITAFFFFRDEESKLGRSPHVSFFDFFNYKYQLCVDGTVAAYRLPYLLAGGSVVFKQESKYFEHFYRDLKPWTHFIPVKTDLSDLTDKIKWARNNDRKAEEIAENARTFVIENLMPEHVLCYYAKFLQDWSELITNEVVIGEEMEQVDIERNVDKRFPPCLCDMEHGEESKLTKDEL